MAKLTLEDISDLRAYEREREELRRRMIELKRVRRVQLGPILTALFENRETIRYQIQEMARAERMLSDAAVQTELDIYNALVPEAGELSVTLFVELTTQDDLRHWLPRLVGIERSLHLQVGEEVVDGEPEAAHEETLTREELTASVHYVGFSLSPAQVERFGKDQVALAIEHPSYSARAILSDEAKRSLLCDLRPGS